MTSEKGIIAHPFYLIIGKKVIIIHRLQLMTGEKVIIGPLLPYKAAKSMYNPC